MARCLEDELMREFESLEVAMAAVPETSALVIVPSSMSAVVIVALPLVTRPLASTVTLA
jgi:hypothetical protein